MNTRVRTAVLILVVLSLAGPPVQAKSYRHPSVAQEIRLAPDGTLEVTDTRAYRFDGEFHNAYLTIDPRRGGEVAFEGVEALDGAPVRAVRTEGNTLHWQYDADNETRVFSIRYRLTGEVDRALDAAHIDRQFLEPEHAPVDSYTVAFHLPNAAGEAGRLFKIFVITARGLVGDLDVDTTTATGTMRLANLRANEFVRLRIFFDPAQVPGVHSIGEPRYEAWLRETSEESQAYRQGLHGSRIRTHAPWPTWLAYLMVIGAAAYAFWAWRTWRAHGVEPRVGEIGPYYREPAEKIPPAAVPYVLDQLSPGVSVAGHALGATFLDFARRGYLSLRERHTEGFLGIGAGEKIDFALTREPQAAEVTPFEQKIWDMLRLAKKTDDVVTAAELKSFFRQNPTWIQEWSRDPRSWYETTHGPLLVGRHGSMMAGMILSAIAMMGILIAVGFFSNNSILLAAGFVSGTFAGLVGLISGAALPRWRPDKLLNARRWRAYSRFLTDFSAMSSAPAEHYKLWDYHFVYAAALGVASAYLANLKKLMAQHPEYFTSPAWIVMNGRAGAAGAAVGLAHVQSNLASIQANLSALESALTTATSAGGGFSGGGAGGSSGGGGSSGAS